MIYLFAGDDAKKKLANYEKFIQALSKSAEIFSISRNNFDPARVESFYSGSTLFSPLSVVIFDGILEREETQDFVLEILPLMEASPNYFIFLEGKLLKPVLDKFKKARAEMNVFELPKEKKEKYDNFLVANAFGSRNKLNTWIYFRQAIDRGVGMEELIGVLFWKIKDMILRKNFNKFSEQELQTFVAKISYLLPEARKAGRDAESAFEEFLLEAF
ncbi:hypothetical protein HYW73_02895 [Candidatus Nomurabacteria bacterium]|nr:hypothetical protein [Candidatus Nomurabacteria bacterium]